MNLPLQGHTYALSTIIGRIVARLRIEMVLTQAQLAERLQFDRSLLTRIETGRNTVNADHLFLLEQVFIRGGRLGHHGDLLYLAARVAGRLKRRGAVPVYGVLPKPDSVGEVETPAVDRVVVLILDEWIAGRADTRGRRPDADEPDEP